MDNSLYLYDCRVLRWVDGDTVDLSVDLGFGISINERVRVYGINAHEIHSKDSAEKNKGQIAAANAKVLAPVGTLVWATTHKANKEEEKFGRWLADIKLADGRDFAKAMIAAGDAVPYFGGPR